MYNGFVALVRYSEAKGDQEFYYVYSPVNVDASWQPEINTDEEIVEITPWRLMDWSEQVVLRKEDWWDSIKPAIDKFWEDVETAKRGEFVIPESTRPTKKPREEKCMIIFNKLDEGGNPFTGETVHESVKDE